MAKVFIAAWTLLVVLVGAFLTSLHAPFRTPPLTLGGNRTGVHEAAWQARYFVSGACLCSLRVLRTLASREPLTGWDEQVVFVEDPTLKPFSSVPSIEAVVRSHGFTVVHVSLAAADGLGIHGVPTLLVRNPQSAVVYSGGLGPKGDQSVAVLEGVRVGHAASRLPAMGCAVGTTWKHKLALLQTSD